MITGETYTEIVDKWNQGAWFWDLGPQEFREKLADMGGDRVEWTATDEELVLGVVEEANASKFSDGMRLEGAPGGAPDGRTGLGRAGEAVRGPRPR